MAAELQEAFGVKAKLVPGSRGTFDIIVDGETVFSKHQTGRFPDEGEIAGIIKK